MKVVIKSIEDSSRWYDEVFEEMEVWVDGELLGRGYYRGEPEDNSRTRTYNWVEPLLQKLAEALGAEVVIEKEDRSK